MKQVHPAPEVVRVRLVLPGGFRVEETKPGVVEAEAAPPPLRGVDAAPWFAILRFLSAATQAREQHCCRGLVHMSSSGSFFFLFSTYLAFFFMRRTSPRLAPFEA